MTHYNGHDNYRAHIDYHLTSFDRTFLTITFLADVTVSEFARGHRIDYYITYPPKRANVERTDFAPH